MPSDPSTVAVAQAAQQIALQMLEERGRGAVLVGVAGWMRPWSICCRR